MKNNIFACMFMMFLVLSLPFVSATNVENFVATGSKGLSDVVNKNDEITFKVDVKLDPEDAPLTLGSLGLLKIVGENSHTISDCIWKNEANRIAQCTKKLNLNTSVGNTYSYGLRFSDMNVLDQKIFHLDTTGPKNINLGAIQNGNKIDYSLSAIDVVDSGMNICSGLTKYDLYLSPLSENSTLTKIGSGILDGSCSDSVNGSVNHGISDAQGEFRICADVFDFFGNNNSMCSSLFIDTHPPEIRSIRLITSNGNPLRNSLHKDGGNVIIEVVAFDTSREMSSDLSRVKINEDPWNSLYLESSTRELTGNSYVLRGPAQVPAEPSLVKVEIKDKAGNVALKEVLFEIKPDVTGPELKTLTSEIMSSDIIFLNSRRKVVATFQESGVGMFEGFAYLDFDNNEIPANDCILKGTSTWECDFYISPNNLSDGVHPFEIGLNTRDDVGNKILEPTQFSVVVDKTPPRLIRDSINISGVSEIGTLPVVGAGSKMLLEFMVDDKSSVTAVANFSLLAPDNVDLSHYVITSSCTDGLCKFESPVIGEGGVNRFINITLTDFAGNINSETIDIKILKVDGEADIWGGKFSLSPKGFDREVSEIVNQRIFIELDLFSDEKDIELVSVDFKDCVTAKNLSSMQGGREYLASFNTISSNTSSSKFHFLAELKRSEIFINEIYLQCQFTVSSYTPDTVYPGEDVVVNLKIGFYNNPIGMPDEAFQKKIDSAVSDTESLLKVLDDIYEWVFWLEKICSIYNMILSFLNAIFGITLALSSNEAAARAMAVTTPAAEGLRGVQSIQCRMGHTQSKAMDGAFMKFIGRFCAWVSCEASLINVFSSDPDFENPGIIGEYDDYLESIFESKWGGILEEHGGNFKDSDSLVQQIIYVCVPGLLRKAHEYRAIKCEYVNCLIDFKDYGGTQKVCSDLKSSLECQFIVGEFWSFLPLSIVENLMELVELFITDQIGAAIMAAHWLCSVFCNSPAMPGWVEGGCGWYFRLTKLANSVGTLYNIVDNFEVQLNWDGLEKSCENMDNSLDKMKEERRTFEDKIRTRTSQAGQNGTDSGIASRLPQNYGGVTPAPSGGVAHNSGTPATGSQGSHDSGTSATGSQIPSDIGGVEHR